MKAEKIIRNCNGKEVIVYPPSEKERIVKEIESTDITINEVKKKYKISTYTLKRWLKAFGTSDKLPVTCVTLPMLEKRQILNELATGKLTRTEALKRYKINETTLAKWSKRYSIELAKQNEPGAMSKSTQFDSPDKESRQIEELRLKVAALETMIDIAEKEFNIPIRKKYGSKQ